MDRMEIEHSVKYCERTKINIIKMIEIRKTIFFDTLCDINRFYKYYVDEDKREKKKRTAEGKKSAEHEEAIISNKLRRKKKISRKKRIMVAATRLYRKKNLQYGSYTHNIIHVL